MLIDNTFLMAGLACLIAALVGGGLNAFGIEIPVLEPVSHQVALGILGLILIGVAFELEAVKPRHDLLATSVHLRWPYSVGLGLTSNEAA